VGVTSRIYRRIDDIETIIVSIGAAVLVGLGGRAT
jgi:hypothetical protein